MDYFFAGETPTDGKPSTVGLEVSKNAINVTQVRKNMNLMFLFWCRQRDVDIIRYVAALLMAVQIDKFLHWHKISVNLAVQIDKFLHWQTGCQCRNLSICTANGRTDSFTLNIIPPSSPSLLSRPTPEKSNPPRQVETNVKKRCENLWTRCKNSYVIPVNVSGQTKIEKKERIKSAGLSPSASFHFDEDDKENVSKYATFLDAYI